MGRLRCWRKRGQGCGVYLRRRGRWQWRRMHRARWLALVNAAHKPSEYACLQFVRIHRTSRYSRSWSDDVGLLDDLDPAFSWFLALPASLWGPMRSEKGPVRRLFRWLQRGRSRGRRGGGGPRSRGMRSVRLIARKITSSKQTLHPRHRHIGCQRMRW